MNEIPKNVSKSTILRNPHLYGSIRPVEAVVPKLGGRPSLEATRPVRKKGKGCVECVITLIAARKREADDDNNIASLKPLRDAISRTLKLDDGDAILRWQYGQCETRGQEGVFVKVELL